MPLNVNISRSELAAVANRPGTRAFERQLLAQAGTALDTGQRPATVLARLEAELRPLALRDNLTPDLTDFYRRLTGDAQSAAIVDLSRHYAADPPHVHRALFAGGCFWCMVSPFDQRPGILAVFSGYTGGTVPHPTYDQILANHTGHVEAVEIIYNERQVTYQALLTIYWQLIDPTDADGQFLDRGTYYRPAIFVRDQAQRRAAKQSKAALTASGTYSRPIVVPILPAQDFWPAENFHQNFYQKNPVRYRRLENTRRRMLRFQRLWQRVKHGLKHR